MMVAALQANRVTYKQKIKETIGTLVSYYYIYLDKYKQRPRDILDLVDGIIYKLLSDKEEKRQIENARRKANGRR